MRRSTCGNDDPEATCSRVVVLMAVGTHHSPLPCPPPPTPPPRSAPLTHREYSKTLNDARLKVLAAREAAIQTVVREARTRVRDVATDGNAYRKLMQDLLVQVCGCDDGKQHLCQVTSPPPVPTTAYACALWHDCWCVVCTRAVLLCHTLHDAGNAQAG